MNFFADLGCPLVTGAATIFKEDGSLAGGRRLLLVPIVGGAMRRSGAVVFASGGEWL